MQSSHDSNWLFVKVSGVPYDDTKTGMGYHGIRDGRVKLAAATRFSDVKWSTMGQYGLNHHPQSLNPKSLKP